jgi:hypothetical protein
VFLPNDDRDFHFTKLRTLRPNLWVMAEVMEKKALSRASRAIARFRVLNRALHSKYWSDNSHYR